MDVRIDFETIPWQAPVAGQRYKVMEAGDQRIRLVEFVEGFVEEGWCTVGHAGRVLEGSLTLETRDADDPEGVRHERLSAGDTVFIPGGDDHAHRAVLGDGERALLVLFESAAEQDSDAGDR